MLLHFSLFVFYSGLGGLVFYSGPGSDVGGASIVCFLFLFASSALPPRRRSIRDRSPPRRLRSARRRSAVAFRPLPLDGLAGCAPVRTTSEKSKRRTRALASTLEPRWNQTFLYSHLRRSELRSRFLEITVWDSDRLDTGRLIGEVIRVVFFKIKPVLVSAESMMTMTANSAFRSIVRERTLSGPASDWIYK